MFSMHLHNLYRSIITLDMVGNRYWLINGGLRYHIKKRVNSSLNLCTMESAIDIYREDIYFSNMSGCGLCLTSNFVRSYILLSWLSM